MSDKKALIDLKTKIIKYIKHIIKTSSAIDEEEIKKYFIFWLYLTDLTDQNVTVDREFFTDNEIEIQYKNELKQKINIYNANNKGKTIPTSLSTKSDYFRIKFYLDCGLYNIENLTTVEYLLKSEEWYTNFANNTEEYKNCMKIDIATPSVPLGTQNVHQYAVTQNRNISPDLHTTNIINDKPADDSQQSYHM
jgi:hypothetical protein